VRIAILDSGVSIDYADSVKGYKDFVSRDDDDDDWQDNTGHGTSAVRLIHKVYHLAEIYVGRVFEGPRATDKTATLMAEAIRHAKNTWKVDIVVMPSGFWSEDIEMEKAIDEARHDHILIFAAASNYGNVVDIAFPGRLYIDLKLFCMFSTDPNVRALPTFNPSVLSKARYSFAILGENVGLPNMEGLLSGTSFATMIGGAVAGRILDFSRHKDNRERIRRTDKLYTVEGMSAVFERMVEGAVDNGYHCIAPWKILSPEVKDEAPTPKRLRERAYICETISRALEDMRRR
jgi:subtilisin family serine protease